MFEIGAYRCLTNPNFTATMYLATNLYYYGFSTNFALRGSFETAVFSAWRAA